MPSSPPTLRVQLLGRFAVHMPTGRRAGPWARPTARRLVQLLCLRPDRRIGREELAEILFPDLGPRSAANGVAKALSMARSAIGPVGERRAPALEADRVSIWISEAVTLRTDHEQLLNDLRGALALSPGTDRDRALSAALEQQGVLLAEEPYAEWAEQARRHLADLTLQAAVELARDRDSGHGRVDPASVVAAWERVAAEDPASEEAAMALMRAHASARQRDQAIRAYVRCVRALREELDAGPSDELEQAYAELVGRDRGQAAALDEAPPLSHRLFGRERLRSALRRRLVRTTAGRGPAVLLVGPTGIGKTRLLAALLDELGTAGWTVLAGRSVPDDRRAPWAALRQALAPVVETGGASDQLLAALGLRTADEPEREPTEGDRLRMAEDVVALLDRCASGRPAVLALDDVQWADPALLALVRRLAARPGPRHWALLLAARSDEPAAPVPDFGSSVEAIPVDPLDPRATAAAVRAALAADGLRIGRARVTQAVERSGGNPFFAIELARAGDGRAHAGNFSVPDAIVALLRRRLESASPAARTMLSIVALSGGEATHELVLAALARLGAPAGAAPAHIGLDELIAARLVAEDGSRLTLAHPLLGDAAVSTVNAIRRSAIHDALADALAGLPGTDATLMAGARHRLAAYEATRLTSSARRAAEAGFAAGHRARHLHAPEVALSLLSAALDGYEAIPAGDREELATAACAAWLTIGNIRLDQDDDRSAEQAYRQALDHASQDEDRARAWSALAGIPYRHGDMQAALAAYRHGLDSLTDSGGRAAARLESDSAWALTRLGRHDEALAIMERVAPVLLGAPETHLRCRTRDRLGLVYDAAGRSAEGLQWLDDGVADAEAHDDDRELAVLCLHRGGLLARLGRHPEAAARDLARAGHIADLAHDRYLRSVVHWSMAELHEAAGYVERALSEREAEIGLLTDIGNDRNLAGAEAHRAQLLHRLGRRSEARSAAARAREAAARTGDRRLAEEIDRTLGPVSGGKGSGRAAS